MSNLLTLTPQGLYCPLGDFYIDPMRPVPRAVITHGHADHARSGHEGVLATPETLAIMSVRYGADFAQRTQELSLHETIRIGAVDVRLYPAGHVLGSAQVCIEAQGERVVVSGDYKRRSDPTCAPFEVVPCDSFVTEATFGLPVYRHPSAASEIGKLLDSVGLFPERAHLVGAYALGKAQRVMALLRQAGYDKPIYIHGAMEKLTRLYQDYGIDLGEIRKVDLKERSTMQGAIVLCPPSALQDTWSRKFPEPVAALASGWMRLRSRARAKLVEMPLIISDHADWDELTQTLRDTGASDIWITHGEADALAHWCGTQGLRAKPLHLIGYMDEGEAA